MIVSVKLIKLWIAFELEVLVLLSLTLQIILIIMGHRRKYIKNFWIRFIVLFPYLIADAVATTALGFLARNTSVFDGRLAANMELEAFWAPFLLLHLGGPDTITAYSLEDNELWRRHLLQLLFQTGFAFYIFVKAWTGSFLSILSIPMLFVGLLKYGERTWVLWSASYEQRRVSCSNFKLSTDIMQYYASSVDGDSLIAEANGFVNKLSKLFFVDAAIFKESLPRMIRPRIWDRMPYAEAFQKIEYQLGLMYDELYTKAMVTYTPWGVGLRFVSFLLSCTVLILFSVSYHKQTYSKVALYVTFLLLTVAVFLELYAALVVLSSNQFVAWLRTHERRNISRAITSLWLFGNPTWSNRMGQFSMLSYFLQENPMGFRRLLLKYIACIRTARPNLLHLYMHETYEYETYQDAPKKLKEFIFGCFSEESKEHQNRVEPMRSSRGKISLERNGYNYDSDILADIIKLDVVNSVIVWHIATEFSFQSDADYFKEINTDDFPPPDRSVYDNIGLCYKISMYLSRYVMHLLVFSPYLLPPGAILSDATIKGIWRVGMRAVKSFGTTEATNDAQKKEGKAKIQSILDNLTEFCQPSAADFTGKLLCHHACRLVDFFSIQSNEQEQVARKWQTICGVWMELLAHISTVCTANQHAQLLRQGGELLTHVSLLMAHLGLTKHFPFFLESVSDNSSR